jgi:hypothetical protein
MRSPLLLVAAAAVVACAKSETGAGDSAAMSVAPAALTAADVQGTWSVVGMAETSDSVTGRWVASPGASDNEIRIVAEGTTDTLTWTRTFDADSMMATSPPFTPPAPAGSPQVVVQSVGRMQGAKLVGTSRTMLAAKPDSLLSRGRWEATRVP